METALRLDLEATPIGEETTRLLLVMVTGGERKAVNDAPAVNLSLVIDRSGSMKGDKLHYVKQAAHELVRRLRTEDTVSVVAYDDRIEVPQSPTTLQNREPIHAAINNLTARNMTNLSGGWLQGCQFVQEGSAEGQVDRVMLLSDGLANRGVTSIAQLKAMARKKRGEGITTTTMGVGMQFNEELMQAMAVEGGGAFYFIDNPDQAMAFFEQELADLQQVVGQNLTITLEPGAALRGVKQLNDYALEGKPGAMSYRLGDIYAGETRTQVFELLLAPDEKGTFTAGEVTIRYDAIEGDTVEHVKLVHAIALRAVPEAKFRAKKQVEEVVRAALFQKAARARERAIALADKRQFEQAAKLLREVARAIEDSGVEDEVLQAEYQRLMEEAAQMDFGERNYDAHLRKLQFAKSHQSRRPDHYATMSSQMHMRHRSKQRAIERNGPAPTQFRMDGQVHRLEKDVIRVGSHASAHIVIDHPDVEATHCRIERKGDAWFLLDSFSRDGTFANGGVARGEFRLSVGDVVTIGPKTMVFE